MAMRINTFYGWYCFACAMGTALAAAVSDISLLGFTAVFVALAFGFHGLNKDERRAQK